jgi:hypothetical protein
VQVVENIFKLQNQNEMEVWFIVYICTCI